MQRIFFQKHVVFYDETFLALDLELQISSSDRQTPCILISFDILRHTFLPVYFACAGTDDDSFTQYQRLVDKYAQGDSEISTTLAKLQLPPDLQVSAPQRAGLVPLPQRQQAGSKQETAVAIRDGRRAAQRLAALSGRTTGSTTSGRSVSGTSSNMRYSARRTSLSTVLEQDFTVEGKKGSLLCPFSAPKITMNTRASQASGTPVSDRPLTSSDMKDNTPHQSADPICAAMYAETTSSAPPSATGSAAKCPIRYLDQHSPEEVARYFETHKHEIPRSHEVCVKRYQRNEDDIRKLDAKYGNLVSMIQGLGQKHQPMLPANQEDEEASELERTSNERVENWAKAVSTDGVGQGDEEPEAEEDEEDREPRFDRPLKEIRVGESPSRPWGISVPIFDPPGSERAVSPPPAPVSVDYAPKPVGKCPFGHGQMEETPERRAPVETPQRPAGKCPFGHGQAVGTAEKRAPMETPVRPAGKCPFGHGGPKAEEEPTPRAQPQPPPVVQTGPAFIQPPEVPRMSGGMPQMIFTGPVFIGYPIDQAMAFMQQYRG